MPAGVANAGLINFTKALADELARDGAKASMMNISEEAAREEFLRDIPIGRFAEPREIAPLIAFLASERNSYITGRARA